MKQSYPQAYYGGLSDAARKKNTSRRSVSYRQELDQFIASLPEGARVLDVGCGEGRALVHMQQMRPDLELFGIDHSDVGALLPQQISFTQGSVENLAELYEADFFDAVVCQHVIEHLISPLLLISGIHRVLCAGGSVFMETPNWTRLMVPFSFLYFWNDYTHIRPYPSFAMNRLLLEHGFSIDTLRTLSTCRWRIPHFLQRTRSERPTNNTESDGAPSAFVHTQRHRSFAAKAFGYALNPLLRDLLIAIAVKEK